jgi:hypothetical protein
VAGVQNVEAAIGQHNPRAVRLLSGYAVNKRVAIEDQRSCVDLLG